MKWELNFHPLTPERWQDLIALFGERGAYGGCWCMWWRKTRRQFEEDQGDGNRKHLHSLVESGVIPGILAYQENRAVGWCSIAPRVQYGSLERSPVLKRIDDQPVWSLVCLYVEKGFRREGVAEALVEAALNYAEQSGATIVEAYPTIDNGKELPPVSSYMGVPRLFESVGFKICARPSKSKLLMRYTIGGENSNE
jgi:ribosomal protein S18 acetylase RimI-like enzyme